MNEMKQICEEFLRESMDFNDVPGLAIGVMAGDETWTGTAGVRDVTTKDPLNPGDVFHCASVSKLFTSLAIMKLVDGGYLDTEDRLADILPDLDLKDPRWEKIRLGQMLSHMSGMDDLEDYHWEEALTGEDALRDYVYSDEVRQLPLLWAPGEGEFSYSNVAYEMLGYIVSLYSKDFTGGEQLSYEDFVKRFLMEPAGMSESTMKTFARFGVRDGEDCPLITEAIREKNREGDPDWKPMALPHEKREDRDIVPVKYYPYTRAHGPSSTLTSTLSDLLRWGKAILESMEDPEGPLKLSGACWEKILGEYAQVPKNKERMGLGFFRRRQEGAWLMGHEGTDDGFRSSFWVCPERKTVTVVLSNLSKAPVKKINKKLFTRLTEGGVVMEECPPAEE